MKRHTGSRRRVERRAVRSRRESREDETERLRRRRRRRTVSESRDMRQTNEREILRLREGEEIRDGEGEETGDGDGEGEEKENSRARTRKKKRRARIETGQRKGKTGLKTENRKGEDRRPDRKSTVQSGPVCAGLWSGYVVAEGTPVREREHEHRLPCCGIGFGWFLFIIGFFLAGIPWYVGAFFLICCKRSVDQREKPGYVACTIAAVLAIIAVIFGVTRIHDD
ncbi:hypothetical protein Cgig2_000624 [Carnegiea gigantea]|uniref:60S ribosomal protein L18a-like protein n=1 Tax=Carnegiea gigantea TaxID=171969 RepID=A0A9Q1KBW7_9CARY|nr:hypothetical protein Cgig2_000624 [Carnegiea gigantea]